VQTLAHSYFLARLADVWIIKPPRSTPYPLLLPSLSIHTSSGSMSVFATSRRAYTKSPTWQNTLHCQIITNKKSQTWNKVIWQLSQLLSAERLDGWRCPPNVPKKQWKNQSAADVTTHLPRCLYRDSWRWPPAWQLSKAHGGSCGMTSPASTDVVINQASVNIQMSPLLDKD